MARRALAALTALAVLGIVRAEWRPVGPGTGSARISILENSTAGTVFEVSVPGLDVSTAS